MQSGLIFIGVNSSTISEVSNKGGEIWSKESHVEDWVQAKERGNVELKIIFTHSLGDGV
jgi:hypothetical protein